MESTCKHRTLLSVREFCESANISKSTFYNLVNAGEGPAVVRIGRKTLVSEPSARNWFERVEQRGGAKTGNGSR